MRWPHAHRFLGVCTILGILTKASSPAELLLQGGTVVNADRQHKADVLIKDSIIAEIADTIQASKGAKVIDASGKYIMPGGIDPHTHLDAPLSGTTTADDFASGQAAGLAGGTTMVIDFVLPTDHDILLGLREYEQKAAKSVADYGFHVAISKFNKKIAEDMAAVVAKGINSFKFFLAYKDVLQVTDEEFVGALERCKELGALPMVHAESGDAVALGQQKTFDAGITGPEGHYISRPDILEDEATYRAIKLAEFAQVPLYVVHVMSSGAASHIREARNQGQRVIGEAVASGIAASEASVFDPDFLTASKFVMSPPIRSKEHQEKLRGGLAGGGLQLIATDHAVFNSTQKLAGLHDFRKIPNGVNGLEERLHVTWDVLVNTGLITPSDFVRLTSTACAQIFNIYPQKGVLAVGSDADVIIFDPQERHTISASTHHSNIDHNIYEGREVRGRVVTTISQGKVVWDGKSLHVEEGIGRFIPAKAFGPLFAGLKDWEKQYLAKKFPYGRIPVERNQRVGRDEL